MDVEFILFDGNQLRINKLVASSVTTVEFSYD
jgi:hypothetical protein